MMVQRKEGISPVVTALLASTALGLFAFAGVSYDEKRYLAAIVTTGLLSAGLLAAQTFVLAWQTVGKNIWKPCTWKPRTWNLRATFQTIVVGLATHYSALVIGVSFGGVYSQEGNIAWDLAAVLVMQAVLTYAACILVNRFR